MIKNKKLIPYGYYCYDHLDTSNNRKYKVVGICPYWSKKRNRPKQENGYCSYLGKGDYEINREKTIIKETSYKHGKKIVRNIYCGPNNPSFMSLIWDQCKMCNINEVEHD